MFNNLINVNWKLFWQRTYQKAKETDIFLNAMGLVYTTLLSIIPLLIFTFYIITLFNFFGKLERITNFLKEAILNNLTTGTGQTLMTILEQYINNIDVTQLGVIGFSSLVITIILTLAKVEKAFNRIWNVSKHRDLFKRFIAFWTFITLGAFLITLSLSLTIPLISSYFSKDLAITNNIFLFRFIIITSQFLIFILAYYLIPNTDVKPSAAIVGGIISCGLFNLAKNLYTIYTTNVITYHQIYGSLSVIPLFLIWLYLTWIIILLGAVITYVFQHRTNLTYFKNSQDITTEFQTLIPIIILIIIYDEFIKEKSTGITLDTLASKIKIPIEIIETSLQNLTNKNLISLTKDNYYVPIVPLENVSIGDILQTESISQQVEIEKIFVDKKICKIYNSLKEKLKNNLEKLTIDEILKDNI